MPSDRHKGGRRNSIVKWRVKAGNKEVFADTVKSKRAFGPKAKR